jgi:flagellar biosynthesis/type III secretory pathway protein FliH
MRLRSARLPVLGEPPAAATFGVWSSLEEDLQAPEVGDDAGDLTAYQKGFEAGARSKAGAIDAALAALDRAHQDLKERMASLDGVYREQSASTLAQIISAAAPAISEAAAKSAIIQIFDDADDESAHPDLSIRVSPDIFDAISEAKNGPAPYCLMRDDSLEAGTVRARWRDGSLECDVGRSLFRIVEFLNAGAQSSHEEI